MHGTAFDYLRNEDLDANTFFNNEQGIARQILKRNQYGGTVGGPIWLPHLVDGRNKLFFFFAYEGQRQNANSQSGKITTFTPLEAQGNFSQSVNGGPDPTVASFLQANPWFQPNPTLASTSHHRSHPHQPGGAQLLQGWAAAHLAGRLSLPAGRGDSPTIPNTWASSITTWACAIR